MWVRDWLEKNKKQKEEEEEDSYELASIKTDI
jgi:hypothetical protein